MSRSSHREDLDRAMKALVREFPAALFRIAGLPVPPEGLSAGDVAINLPELRADHLFLIRNEAGIVVRAVYFEYQLRPDRRALPGWFYKTAALTRQLGVPVLLVVIYLERSRYRRFPDRYECEWNGISNQFQFHSVRLWEHSDRIRSRELAELAPLLVLCEDKPDIRTVREERALIRSLPASNQERADLFALALLVGQRYFTRQALEAALAEDMEMARSSGIIGDWLDEAESKGRTETAREFALRLLRERYPQIPESAVERVGREGVEWCEELAVRLVRGESLTDLGL